MIGMQVALAASIISQQKNERLIAAREKQHVARLKFYFDLSKNPDKTAQTIYENGKIIHIEEIK
jgi:hypothetical protein